MSTNFMYTDTDTDTASTAFDSGPQRQLWADLGPAQDRRSYFGICDGIAAEIFRATSYERSAFRFRAPVHMLVVHEQGARYDGETFIEGSTRSRVRDFTRKLTFVPAEHDYGEWQEPWTLARLMYVYFDPAKLFFLSGANMGVTMAPKLFFEDARLFSTALKLKRALESWTSEHPQYLKALGVVLAHELIRFHRAASLS